jgi:uncharacterized protein (DUF736 family)
MKIGAAWKKEKDGKPYLSMSIDKALMPLNIDNTKALVLFINEKKEKTEHPDYILCMDVKKPKEEEKIKEGEDFLF